MNKLNIVTERLFITELNPDMAESVHLNSLDEDMRRFVPDEVFETVDAARDVIEYLISCYKNGGPLVYPVILKAGPNIGYVQAVPLGNEWEIGYHIAKKYTGKGYATEAVKAFLPVIMRALDITKISGICLEENQSSRMVLNKCGFILEYQGSGDYKGDKRKICRFRYERADDK